MKDIIIRDETLVHGGDAAGLRRILDVVIGAKPSKAIVREYQREESTALVTWVSNHATGCLGRVQPRAVIEACEYMLDSRIEE